MSIKDSTVNKVREIPLTEILKAESIAFKKNGRESVTLCPWHNDSSPSLTINDDKGLCFCFACGGGSDSIAYVRQKFGLSFVEAIERIAIKHQIPIEYDNIDPQEAIKIAEERKRMYTELQTKQGRFRYNIKSEYGASARQWLKGRGVTPEASRYFELGWATSGYFSDRITIPIHDHKGNIVGFTGRVITQDVSTQKYKNSPASEIFNKSNLIFNEHRALEAARTSGSLIFVEGHLDVVAMWQAGIRNVVAMQGTAAPPIESIKRLTRHCKRFILCYDGDAGGHSAIEHFVKVAGPLACSGELTLTIAKLPEGKDPDDCIQEGIDLYSIIEEAPQWLDWQIDFWLANIDRSDTHKFSKIEAAIRKLVESIKSPALRQYYVDKSASILSKDIKSASKLAKNWNKSLPKLKHAGSWDKPTPAWTRYQSEKRILRHYVHFSESRKELQPLMQHLQLPSHIWLWNRITEIELFTENLTPSMVMTVLAVSEPQYMRTLRPIVCPTITLRSERGIMEHAKSILLTRIEVDA